MDKPLVSVVMPVFNGEKFITESVESVLNQTYTNWELIIVNDGSIDSTEQILQHYLSDKRITYYKNKKNMGLAYTYNFIFSNIKGKYIAIQEQDDISLLFRLEKEVQALEQNPVCKFVFSPAVFIDINGDDFTIWGGDGLEEGVHKPGEIFYKLYVRGTFIDSPSLLLRTPPLYFTEQYKIANDFNNYLQICHDHPICFIKQPLVKIRRGAGHASLSSNRRSLFREERRIIKNAYALYSNCDYLPITFFVYSRAMSCQLIKEGRFYFKNGYTLKSALFMLGAVIYNPIDADNWRVIAECFLPGATLKLIRKFKNMVAGMRLKWTYQ